MLIFAEMTWNDPDVVVYSFQCHSCVLVESIQDSNFSIGTDYGRPMKPFSLKSQTFGLGQTNWQINFGAFGVLSAKFLECFPVFNHYFYKNLAFLISIWAAKN